jgi:hypothetical protein
MPNKDLINLGGDKLISGVYHGSVGQLLSTLYPDRDWLPWKFEERLLNFWDDVNNQRKYMDWVAKELNVKEMSDWYKVTQKVAHVRY